MRSAAPARRLALLLAVFVAAAGFGVAAVTIDAAGGSSPAHTSRVPASPATSAIELRAGNAVPAVVRAHIESAVDRAADPSRRPFLRAISLAAVLALLTAVAAGDRRRRAAIATGVPHPTTLRRAGGPTRAPPFGLSTPA
jgi:hypothetical protein